MRTSLLLVWLAVLLGARLVSAQQQGVRVANAYRAAHEAGILADFARLLALPNVARDSANIARNANTLATLLQQHGVASEIWKLPGAPPVVFGELRVPGATRTLGVYVHYDGQPADPADWKHDPWQPTLYSRALEAGGQPIAMPRAGEPVDPEWRIYARSAGDDKAPIAALFPVLRALREAGVQPTSNLKFFFEGEEEAGSDHLREYLEQHRAKLDDIDAWLFFDGPMHQSGRPQLVFGVRGVIGFEITVYGATRALHSGHYGNWAPSAPQMLAELIATLKNEDGRVLVDGFYDSVAPLGAQERAALAALPDHDAALKRELGLVRTEGQGANLNERLLLPSLNIRGISAGNTGAQARNVIPNTASASFDIRLVKGNGPDAMVDLVEAHVRKLGYHVVRTDPDLETRLRHPRIARINRESGYPAARTSMDLPIVQEIITGARALTGDDLLLVPALGGSLPIHLFTEYLNKPVVIVPVANHDNNQHAADENLRIGNLWFAIDLYGALLTMAPRPRMTP